MPPINKSKLDEVPESVTRALGTVSAVTTNKFVTVRFYDIPNNHPAIRDKEIQFRFDVLPFSAFSLGDAVQAGWTKNTPKDKTTGAFKIQGTIGACFLRLVDDTKHGSDTDTWLKDSARQLRAQVERKMKTPQNKRTPANAERAIQVSSSGDVNTGILPGQSLLGDLIQPGWLPVPVGLPQMDDEWFFDEHYIRIGYVSFIVDSPAEEIRVSEAAPFDQVNTLRSRSPIQKNNWHVTQQVTISLTLADNDATNRVLLPLIRLFDRAPFLPVFNKLLFEHNITALALQDVSISTIPGYPNALRAQLICLPFNWIPFFPSAKEFSGLDALFCYPLLKIWAEQPRRGVPEYLPILGRWDGQFSMKHPSEDWLEAVSEFPERSERARSYNEEIGFANQIRLWRLTGVPARYEGTVQAFDGFTVASPGTVNREFGEARIPSLVLSQDVGRATVDLRPTGIEQPPSEYAFIRIRSREHAIKLAQHEDCVVILKQPVVLLRLNSTHTATVVVGGNWVISGADGRVDSISRTTFLEFLRQNDPPTLAALADGQYIFVTHAHTKLIDRIADIEFAKLPKNPDEPQTDEENIFDLRTLNIEVISVSKSNTFAPLQVRGQRTPTYQYLGSSPKYYQVGGTIPESTNVHQIQSFFERANDLGRRFKGKMDGTPFGGFIIVENELFNLMGTKYVLPLAWSTSTVPNFPGVIKFEMTLVEFDNTQRQREALVDLMKGVSLDSIKRKESLTDAPFIRYIRQEDIRKRLRAIELYPDLALPTYSEIRKWLRDIREDRVWDWSGLGKGKPHVGYDYLSYSRGGTGWQWTVSPKEIKEQGERQVMLIPEEFKRLADPPDPNRFADPDFYCGQSSEYGTKFVDRVVNNVKKNPIHISDTYGTKIPDYYPGSMLSWKSVKPENDPYDTIRKGLEAVGKVRPLGADSKLIDKVNHNLITAPGTISQEEITIERLPTPEMPEIKPLHPFNEKDFPIKPNQSKLTPAGKDQFEIERLPAPLVPPQLRVIPEFGSSEGTIQRLPTPEGPTIQPLGTPPQKGSVSKFEGGTVKDRAIHYGGAAINSAFANDVPVDLFMALIEQESQWKQSARSRSGAVGLGQLLPGTAKELGVDPYDPASNLWGAAKYLGKLLKMFKDRDPQTKEQLALAAYNAGPGAVKKFNGIPPYKETRNYVKRILVLRSKYTQQLLGQGTQNPTGGSETGYQRQQLLKQFNSGYGYNLTKIERYIIDSNKTPTADSDMIRFVQSSWLRSVYDTGFSSFGLVTTGGKREHWVVIDNIHIHSFLSASKLAGITLPLEKIPFRLQGPSLLNANIPNHPVHPTTINQSFHEPITKKDMFHDLRRSYTQGRLLQAFPTFYIALVDGGRSLRVWRLFDHIYGMFSITNIAVHRTRKGPIETAVVGFSNLYGHLTAQTQQISQQQERDTRHIWNLPAIWRGFKAYIDGIDTEMVAQWSKHLETIMLKPGARLHIRLGYGSDANDLPIVFNGVITEVPLSEGEVQVVALSDGVELTNDVPPTDLQGSIPVTRLNSSFGSGKNPRELIMEYMAPNTLLNAISQALGKTVSPIFYYNFRNEFGIEHFGEPIRQKLVGFDDGEIGINIYNPESSTPYNQSTAWDSHLRILQVWRWDKNTNLVGINMHQATPWNIFEAVRKTVPDYILYPVPVDFRSTLFFGKGWFPFYYKYKKDFETLNASPLDAAVEELYESKPFQQFHFLSSDWNLIGNQVRADATDVVTQCQAVGTYNGWMPGDNDLTNENSFLMCVDLDIYDEFQKRIVVESGLYTTVAMKLDEANSDPNGKWRVLISAVLLAIGKIFGSGPAAVAGTFGLLEGPARKFFLSRRIMDNVAAMTLKDHIKEMYQGELTILGNAYIKPYDYLGIVDKMSGLNGLAEAKEVTHTMSLETGFVTSVSPDCISNYMDYDARDSLMWLATTLSHLAVSVGAAHIVGNLSRQLTPYIALRSARRLRDFVRKETAKTISPVKGDPILAPLANKFKATVEADVRALEQALKNKNTGTMRAIFNKFVTNDQYLQIYKDLPLDLKVDLQVQNALRSIPGALQRAKEVQSKIKAAVQAGVDYVDDIGELNKYTKATKDSAKKAIQFTKDQNKKLHDALSNLPDKATKALTEQVDEAKKILSHFDPKEVERVKQILDSGEKPFKLNPDIVKALRQQTQAQAKLNGLAKAASKLSSVKRLPAGFGVLRGLIGRTGAGVFLAGLFNIAIGGISDYLIRWDVARQCLTILPLRVWDKNLEAGINGHRGAVYGDPQIGVIDNWLETGMDLARNNFFIGLLPIIGDMAQEEHRYRHEEFPTILPEHSETQTAE